MALRQKRAKGTTIIFAFTMSGRSLLDSVSYSIRVWYQILSLQVRKQGYTVNREIFGVQIFQDGLWYPKIKNTKIFRQRTFTSTRVSDGPLVSENICTRKLQIRNFVDTKISRFTVIEILMFSFLNLQEGQHYFASTFHNRTANVFVCKCYALLCFSFREAAPIPYIQAAILNMTYPYLRSITVLLDQV